MRHRRAVGLHEQVVDEVDAEVDVLQAGEQLGVRGLGEPLAVEVDRVEGVLAARELRAGLGREDLLPRVMPLERRQVRGADEALRLVVEARPRDRARQPLDERPRQPGSPAGPQREQVGHVRVVAAEELVAALARERHLHVLGGQLRDEVGRERGRVRERLVERLGERGQEQRRVGLEHELVVVRAVALGDEPRVGELVERALLEADRERAERLGALLRGQRGQRRRVDPAREQHADRDVRDEVGADGVAQPRTQLLDQLCLVVVPQRLGRCRRGPCVALEPDLALLPDEQVAGRELARVAEDRQRRRDRVEGEEGLQRLEVDLAAREARASSEANSSPSPLAR